MDPSYGIAAPDFRLPAGTHVGAVSLQVSDLARSIEYYTRVLGLAVLSADRSRASLSAAGAAEPLLHLATRPGVKAVPRHGRLGLYHFAILVPDRAALGRFIVHLAETGAAAATADHAVSEAVYLWDPDGLGIEVYADRPRDAWRRRGRELHMTTEALDVRSLVDATGGSPWTGLPDGTVIGHMHMHVGDLRQAEQVYHAALGLDKVVWSYPGALFLSAGGYHHHLGVNTWASGAPPAHDDDARLLEWEVVVPTGSDAREAVASCERAGLPVAGSGGGSTIHDPWGTAFRLRSEVD
jgi:catechol 2,3-dioxygenase